MLAGHDNARICRSWRLLPVADLRDGYVLACLSAEASRHGGADPAVSAGALALDHRLRHLRSTHPAYVEELLEQHS
jgi:hypothetical protein